MQRFLQVPILLLTAIALLWTAILPFQAIDLTGKYQASDEPAPAGSSPCSLGEKVEEDVDWLLQPAPAYLILLPEAIPDLAIAAFPSVPWPTSQPLIYLFHDLRR